MKPIYFVIAIVFILVVIIIFTVQSNGQSLPCYNSQYHAYTVNKDMKIVSSGSKETSVAIPITQLMSDVEENSGNKVVHPYAITSSIVLYNRNVGKGEAFNVILDTGSFDLIVNTNTSAEGNPDYDKKDGQWTYGYDCVVLNSDDTINFGSGSLNVELVNAYLLVGRAAINVLVKLITGGTIPFNICGLLPGKFAPEKYGFINYILDGLNSERGFTIDLKSNKLTLGKIAKGAFMIELLNEATLKQIYANNLPLRIPFYMTKMYSINGYVPETTDNEVVYLMYDTGNTFISVSNDYTLRLLKRAIGVDLANPDENKHNTIDITVKNSKDETYTFSSKTPLSLEPGENKPYYYIELKSPFTADDSNGYNIKLNLISVGLNFQLGTVIGYDLANFAMYID